jgi:hypothetical protein
MSRSNWNQRKACALVGLTIAFSGCDRTRTEYSPELSEPARVITLLHSPGYHRSTSDLGLAIDGNGNATPVVTSSTIAIPETWGAVFECQHGRFVVQGPRGSNGHACFLALVPGEDVTVRYREIWERVYNSDDKLLRERLIDYDFVRADRGRPPAEAE